ncbi:simple sugar transport system substrate-binding protein/ribose transport system substrate-binding protein [Micromonospora phaseoli]|uniref:Simple sugar transport system substrate-binding protein/ribose transport system substrate-binding protein n=1 Tax=Micromonospora phaseoli TaxID=1144548 RepID=A0A1H6V7D3_9ACTN|nr:sugar ABC transporter substrate-binding protein [Micromonospora phaseoli]PZV93836.1 simple sugar transport system substrate-binding protein/ribose transport system substrate-binding protein [Micromonospora phaseoli]GIJ80721.1 ABC transporter substrate-binding protein [Micromonospora phaseoli]SEI96175.1 simple sugar transport system substrate-binding protein/ribose transport system substrate-binding protein [Micromonospora phaseoli]
MNRRALLSVGLTLMLGASVTLAAGCGDGAGGGTGAGGSELLVGVDYPRSDTDFWNSYIKYVPQFADEADVELKTTNSQNDIANLISNAQAFMSQGVKGVVMAPQDTAAIAPTLAQLDDRKIPVVTIDTRPDTGNVFMVVRADNRAYGIKACQFLGTKLSGTGKVVMLQGGLDSINGRDRTEAFNECMQQEFPGITVFGEATDWKADVAASKLQTRFASDPDIKGIYMQSSFALSGTLQILKQRGLQVPPTDPKHVFVVSNDGIPEELKNIGAGLIDATVSQPADLYAKHGLEYVKAAIEGKTFQPGPTDHGSTIIQVREGLLEDQLPAPLVTLDGGPIAGEPTLKFDDASLWGNNA